jgi:hypothetical protein
MVEKAEKPSASAPERYQAVSVGPAVRVAEGAQPSEAERKVAPAAQGAQVPPYEYVAPEQLATAVMSGQLVEPASELVPEAQLTQNMELLAPGEMPKVPVGHGTGAAPPPGQ